jgi:hypothetical protein
VDRLLAAGSVSVRSIAGRFGLTKSSLLRHQKTHLLQVIERQMQRRRQREDELVAETWSTRLEHTYQLAREGVDRATADSEKWTAAVGFLNVMAKSAETGMKATGEFQSDREPTIQIDSIIILPQAMPADTPPAVDDTVIDTKAIPAPEEE